MKKCASKTASKKGGPPDSNDTLLTCQEAPGEAASRAHCTDKKQLFEQQLKHCSSFLHKKVGWARNRCRKATGSLNRRQKTEWITENGGLLKTKAKVQTIVETNEGSNNC